MKNIFVCSSAVNEEEIQEIVIERLHGREPEID
jgi:hypothetical protein